MDVEHVNSATSANDIYARPDLADNKCEHSISKCMDAIQHILRNIMPTVPTHRPARSLARGNAKIPAPMLPLIR